MLELVADKRAEIAALCERYGVRRLDLFGSATTGAFHPAASDLDFIVDFMDYGPGVARRFIGFGDALEALFGRRVDFVFDSKLTNPYFKASVDASREKIYEAGYGGAAPRCPGIAFPGDSRQMRT